MNIYGLLSNDTFPRALTQFLYFNFIPFICKLALHLYIYLKPSPDTISVLVETLQRTFFSNYYTLSNANTTFHIYINSSKLNIPPNSIPRFRESITDVSQNIPRRTRCIRCARIDRKRVTIHPDANAEQSPEIPSSSGRHRNDA